jgi:hypothetical protein
MAKKQARQRDEKGRFISNPKTKPSKQPDVKSKVQETSKDSLKVKAGKQRSSTGIRDKNGRYVSKIFTNEVKKTILATKKIDVSKINPDQTEKIDKLLKEAKVSAKEIKRFYEKNQFIFEDLLEKGKLKGTSKNSTQIENTIENYKGKIFINDGKNIKEYSKSDAKLLLVSFKSFLSDNINVVDFTLKPTLTLDGTLTINIPDSKKLLKDIKTYFGVTNKADLEDFTGAEIMEALEDILNGYYGEESDLIIYAS